MTVITKTVIIENESFVLISDTSADRKYYGTIPTDAIDSHGKLSRPMNGITMCIDWYSIPEAIENRRRDILFKRMLQPYIDSGMDRKTAIQTVITTPEYLKLMGFVEG